MVLRATDRFEVTWDDPEDADRSWVHDPMHAPRPLVPMAQPIYSRCMWRAFNMPSVVVNGYFFMVRADQRWPEPGATEAEGRTAAELWTQVYEPRVRAGIDAIQRRDYGSMPMERLADAIDDLFEKAAQTIRDTMVVMMSLVAETELLFDYCTAHFGGDGEALAVAMIQGLENETATAGAGLDGLARLAGQSPELAAAIRDGRYDDIGRCAGGDGFRVELQRFLDEYGWRAGSWTDLHEPTWAEDPAAPLGLIARYLQDPERAPAASQRRSREQREEARREALARLPDAASRDQLRALLATAEHYVGVIEGRARWQLTITGVLRIPLLELGRRFVDASALTEPDDVMYLYPAEARELAAGALDGARELVAQRRTDHARWTALTPPPYIGAKPPPAPPNRLAERMIGAAPAPPPDEQTVTGTGASQGVASGTARVIGSLDEAHRLQSGDVLVCRSTAPPWTPLFAIAGAVVTDTGGILSHSAIVAREYGIPAVVGTRVATQRIPDGATVTVDGGAGEVRIEP